MSESMRSQGESFNSRTEVVEAILDHRHNLTQLLSALNDHPAPDIEDIQTLVRPQHVLAILNRLEVGNLEQREVGAWASTVHTLIAMGHCYPEPKGVFQILEELQELEFITRKLAGDYIRRCAILLPTAKET